MRFFNTAGPTDCKKHYCTPPLERLNLKGILSLIDQEKYFVLHAPRQTGKTTCLLALMDHLNQQGNYRCLYFNVEVGQFAREDVKRGMTAILSEMASMARTSLGDVFLKDIWRDVFEQSGEGGALNELLTLWSQQSPKPLVLLIDEIDSLVGDTLISVLRQLRAGYTKRPTLFPQSIVLCGVRDVRDYRIHSSRDKAVITGGSTFNIKAKSLRLGDFSQKEIELLYRQHTEETGQTISVDALELKILYGALESSLEKGLEQTWAYMDHCGTNEGHLVIFDRDSDKSWDEKIFCREEEYQGKNIKVWGM